jgi:GRAM domain
MDLQDDERLVWSKRANSSRGQRPVGGKLYLTDRRLIFYPNGFERWISDKSVEAALQDIGTGSIEPRGRGLLAARYANACGSNLMTARRTCLS